MLTVGSRLLLTLEIRDDGDDTRLSAVKFEPLDDVLARQGAEYRVIVKDPSALRSIKSALDASVPGEDRLTLVVRLEDASEVDLRLPSKIHATGDVIGCLANLQGVGAIRDTAAGNSGLRQAAG